MSYYSGMAGLAGGIMKGMEQNKQDDKEKTQEAKLAEQLKYDRNRQAIADDQSTKNFDQSYKMNTMKLGEAERELGEAAKQRENKKQFAALYGQHANGDAAGMVASVNSMIKPTMGLNGSQQMRYDLDTDGTLSLNIYDANDPTKLISNKAKGITTESLLSKARSLYDPDGALETYLSNQADQAKSQAKIAEAVGIEAGKQPYALQRLGQQGLNAQQLAAINNNSRENIVQFQAKERAARDAALGENRLQVAGISAAGKGGSKVGAMVQGALSYLQSNPAILAGMSPEDQQLAIANIAIETAGKPRNSPVGAQGLMQIMPIARKDVMQRGAADPYANDAQNVQGGMLQLKRLREKFGGDMDKAIAANNWGESSLAKHIAKQTKAGLDWKVGLPTETANHIARFNEANQILSGQQSQIKGNAANLVASQIDPLVTRMTKDFKDIDGFNPPMARGSLNQASTLLSKSLGTNDINERKALYSQAGDVIVRMLGTTGMPMQQRYNYRDTLLQALLGEQSLAEVGRKMGFAQQRIGANQPSSDKRVNQRAQAPTTANPYLNPEEDVFKQAEGVDRSAINAAMRS